MILWLVSAAMGRETSGELEASWTIGFIDGWPGKDGLDRLWRIIFAELLFMLF